MFNFLFLILISISAISETSEFNSHFIEKYCFKTPENQVYKDKSEFLRAKLLAKVPYKNGKVKIAFFDADSTLRVAKSKDSDTGKYSVTANSRTDVLLLPFVSKKIKELNENGYMIVIVSNQGGVGTHITYESSEQALCYAAGLIKEKGGLVHMFLMGDTKDNRKPYLTLYHQVLGIINQLPKTHSFEYSQIPFEFKEIIVNQAGETDLVDFSSPLFTRKESVNLSIDIENSFMVGDSAYKKKMGSYPGDLREDNKKIGAHFSNADRLFAINIGLKAKILDATLKENPVPGFIEASPFFSIRKTHYLNDGDLDLFEDLKVLCDWAGKNTDLLKNSQEKEILESCKL